ncbi:LytTR family DNA-binding domain-containing protein [uncultured Cohaesibacter sp.]|uniref:LytR/AlgR family response regulator transcription factor n=1 Tax=uncultured Cohaesibacter sp. TaxID=1002546 RepID=UPI0029307254|nr:LytTR family DNA-binding domain-containing protein [uncultured Cohaesibacter sp.]
MQVRCLIVDDEKPARDELRFLLSEQESIDVVAEAESAEAAINLSRSIRPDVIFLDIQMGRQTGFDVIRTLMQEQENPPLFVFVTAFDSYAVDAFEASAVDYILKPVSEARLSTTLSRISKLMTERGDPLKQKLEHLLAQVSNKPNMQPAHTRISVETKGRIRLVDPEEIVYFDCEDSRIIAHTKNGEMPIYGISSMDRLEDHLSGSSFFRAHRSTLVNLNAIREFSPWFNGKYSLVMTDQKRSELTISRSRVKDFKLRLGL